MTGNPRWLTVNRRRSTANRRRLTRQLPAVDRQPLAFDEDDQLTAVGDCLRGLVMQRQLLYVPTALHCPSKHAACANCASQAVPVGVLAQPPLFSPWGRPSDAGKFNTPNCQTLRPFLDSNQAHKHSQRRPTAHSQASKMNGREEQTDCRQQRNRTGLPPPERMHKGQEVPLIAQKNFTGKTSAPKLSLYTADTIADARDKHQLAVRHTRSGSSFCLSLTVTRPHRSFLHCPNPQTPGRRR